LEGPANLIGRSRAIREVLRIVKKVSATDSTVLILGESGTGKELVARHIHFNSRRNDKPIISVNCSAFSDTLLESELFGYKKGAFSGATGSKTGLFQMAHGGTLFLDEVSEMSPDMQKKLLRVLEDGEVRPLGSNEVVKTDARIIAATNRDLKDMVKQNRFRDDLYFRLNVICIQIPPLRERVEDIPLLIEHYKNKICGELERPGVAIPEAIESLFLEYDWPGNVRELVNELRRVIILESQYSFQQSSENGRKVVKSQELEVEALPISDDSSDSGKSLSSMEKQTIVSALQESHGNKSKAAEMLGIARRTLYEKMKRFRIE